MLRVLVKRFFLRWVIWYKRLLQRSRRECRGAGAHFVTRPPFRKARLAQGLSLDTVSRQLGIPRSTIEKIETGRYNNVGLSLAFLNRILEQYGAFLGLSEQEVRAYIVGLPSGKSVLTKMFWRCVRCLIHYTRMSFVLSLCLCVSLYVCGAGDASKERNGVNDQALQLIMTAIKKSEVCRLGKKCDTNTTKDKEQTDA